MSGLAKRSISISGHRTSLALEAEFWAVLDAEAERRAISLPRLIAEIDETRLAADSDRPLASALRVYALALVTRK
ncbi:MAG: ribbon-helix-helix domain-containing protein [Caulobacterales bacterium]|jgi:predicted DNA-binding ribbon-helix-helix protein